MVPLEMIARNDAVSTLQLAQNTSAKKNHHHLKQDGNETMFQMHHLLQAPHCLSS